MRFAGLGVWLALVVGSGTAAGQGIHGGPLTSDYAKRLLGEAPPRPATPRPLVTVDCRNGKTTLLDPVTRRPIRSFYPHQADARGARGALLRHDPGRALPTPPPSKWKERLNGITHGPNLPGAVREMAAEAQTLTPGDVRALRGIARKRGHRRHAAPEMRDALRRIAKEHPDRRVRNDAARAADDLELQAHLVELRRQVEAMRDDGKRGVEIWSEIAKRSVDHHKDRTDLTDAQKFDEVIADLGAVFNGPDAKRHLETYENTFGYLPYSDPNVDTVIRALGKRDLHAAFAPKVDTTKGADFKPEFRDGTKGQVYHTNFFVVLGYAAGKHDPSAVGSVNLYHETIDAALQGGGGSVADFRASKRGAEVGDVIRRFRDGDAPHVTPRRALEAIPTLIGSFFSNHPRDFARPWGADGPDYSKLAR